MDPKKIERINELARKKRTVGLTEGEGQEQGRRESGREEPFHGEDLLFCWSRLYYSLRGLAIQEDLWYIYL